ncbi:hypothetical protein [Mycobacterium sp. 1274756.6]|uniref:hypothetical protein n=1 Tax=Mycobacterium sp. 1274756.6 TaxID=1834076 RepID=UPI0008013E37|nr:hypothetical protein [Mycobacterium sp. 1274756.6]OBJ69137.1 hypothetical protein A5643_13005 [Mycobacterium sp. 1274756.6]
MERAQALTEQRVATRYRNGFVALAAIGFTAAVLGSFFHPRLATPWVWLLVLGGLACGAAGLVGARAATARMRFRVTQPRWLLLAQAAVLPTCAMGASWALGNLVGASSGGFGPVTIGLVIPIALLALFATILNAESLFDGDADGVRFIQRGRQLRRTRIPWADIAAIVVATGARPKTVEIGVRTRPGVATRPFTLRAGELLTDLPYRIVAPRTSFSLDDIGGMLNRSGRTDIALLHRTPAGEILLGHANAWTSRAPSPASGTRRFDPAGSPPA